MKLLTLSLTLCSLACAFGATETPPLPARTLAPGPFKPDWASLEKGYQCPDWFRDAKFGIWAHWTAQCIPEQGDWYARKMYIEGDKDYKYHLEHYGHPSEFGFKDIDNLWKAEHWDPEKLIKLYKRAGAKYFVALANHHDNFDNYDSKYHAWNSVNIGPKKDIVGTWAKIARENGLRFGVTNHSAHAWHWFQTAYGHDAEDGAKPDVPYDGWLTKEDGKGKWWEGYDPQELYSGPNIAMPKDLKLADAKAVQQWHEKNTRPWQENPPPNNQPFVDRWFLRCQDLLDKYHPDLLYFDNTGLPLGQAGLDIAAHFYNASRQWNGGKLEAVLNTKKLPPEQRSAVVEDYERGFSDEIQPAAWQTDTCIGDWHYSRPLYDRHGYKTVAQVVRMLVDIVSKNGNLLLNIPLRGDGTIDDQEEAFLNGLAKWMEINSEGIFGSRPWKIYGEGPTRVAGGMFNENKANYGAQDIRFTTKNGALYAYFLDWPADGQLMVHALHKPDATKPSPLEEKIADISLLGSTNKVTWSQEADGLKVKLPAVKPGDYAFALRITLTHG